MTVLLSSPELLLRSLDATWNRQRWEHLPADGHRYEVIDGVLYMSTAPSPRHQWVLRQLQRVLFRQIDDAELGITLAGPIGLFMPGCDPVQPDLLILRPDQVTMVGPRRIEGVPAVLIEVLSPSNADQDLTVKRAVYARASVPEYWVIRPGEGDALVHSQPEPATGHSLQVVHVPADGTLQSAALPFQAPVATLFAGAPPVSE
jgi:Uma2 family endonuclease